MAALLKALLAGIRLNEAACCVATVVDGADDGVLEVVDAADEVAVELRVEASGTPDVAERMRYIKALAVNLEARWYKLIFLI
jgi:hypothetical protein